MDKPAIIEGNYVDLRFMPGLKCSRISIDINIEESNVFLEMFRAPDRVNPVRVVIARMVDGPTIDQPETPRGKLEAPTGRQDDSGPTIREPESRTTSTEGLSRALPTENLGEASDKPKRFFRELAKSAQAAMMCEKPEFQAWIECEHHGVERRQFLDETDYARAILIEILGITSRKELDTMPSKAALWDKLLASYDFRDQVRA